MGEGSRRAEAGDNGPEVSKPPERVNKEVRDILAAVPMAWIRRRINHSADLQRMQIVGCSTAT